MIKAALRNPIAILMLSIGILLMGSMAIRRLPVELFPRLSVPVIIVGTSFRGAAPETVEQSVTFPVESAVAQAWNISDVTSTSRQGMSVVYAWFRWGSDIDAALLDVQQQVQAIGDELPEHARPPMISKFDLSSLPVAFVTVKGGGLDERALFELTDGVLAPQISGVEGVAAATTSGGRRRQMNIDVDPDRLREMGLSLLDIEDAIRRSNVLVPSGSLRSGALEYNVFSNAQMTTLAEVEEVVVKVMTPLGSDSEVAIRIKDVATVTDSHRQQSQIVHVDGERAVYLKVYKQPGANTISTVEALREAIGELHGVPPGVRVETTFEQSVYIENAIESLRHDALLGAAIVMAVLLFFLGRFSSTLIAGISLPLAFFATLSVLYLTGETINVFTLGGLALAIGRLVDNAIIVLEVVQRHQEEGKTPLRAALDGSREVAVPVLAGTLTTIVVFIPVWFLSGISRYLFTPMGLTISVAMAASYLISLTVIPVLMCRFYRPPDAKPALLERAARPFFDASQRMIERLERGYGGALDRIMARKGLLLTGVFAAFVGAMGLATQIGADFFPPIDEGEFRVKVRTPIGSRVETTEEVAKRIETMIREEVPARDLVGTNASIGAAKSGLRAMLASNSGPHVVTVRVELSPPGEREHDMEHYISRLRKRAGDELPGMSVVFEPRGTVRTIINFGQKAPIVVEARGYDLAQGSALASEIEKIMLSVPGLSDVKSIRQDDYPNVEIDVDRRHAARFGITQEEVARTLLASVFGNMSKAPFMVDPETGFPYEIITRLRESNRDEVEDIEQITLQHEGKPILLKSFAKVTRSTGPLEIERRNMQRIAEVIANVEPGANVSDVAEQINARLEALEVPPGFSVNLVGQADNQAETNRALMGALAVALGIVYMIMAIQFRSLLHPLIVLFTVPLGLIGVFVLMYATSTTFSATSMMGIIMMVGIVVANGILIVDTANTEREKGSSAAASALHACKLRLRPILMTSLTMVFGLIPMAIGGPGGELYAPLARAVMGGLLASTVLTLFVLPILYALVEGRFPSDTEGRKRADAELGAA